MMVGAALGGGSGVGAYYAAGSIRKSLTGIAFDAGRYKQPVVAGVVGAVVGGLAVFAPRWAAALAAGALAGVLVLSLMVDVV